MDNLQEGAADDTRGREEGLDVFPPGGFYDVGEGVSDRRRSGPNWIHGRHFMCLTIYRRSTRK